MISERLHLKFLFLLPLILICFQHSSAQFTWGELGVNGLTCSSCTRSVEISILKLDFVKEVQMNLENTNGKIAFKEGMEVNLKKIAHAVTDAGFSVRYLKVAYPFSDLDITGNVTLLNASGQFCFVNTAVKKLSGEMLMTVINKEFMTRHDYKDWNEAIEKSCGEVKKEIYYVTLQQQGNE